MRLRFKKSKTKPWIRREWRIRGMAEEYLARMDDALLLYKMPYDPEHPVIYMDEGSKMLQKDKVAPKPMALGRPMRIDYQYIQWDTVPFFLAVEPKGGYRLVMSSKWRTRVDFARALIEVRDSYPEAGKIRLVLDNLNTHDPTKLHDVLSRDGYSKVLQKVEFHFTPKTQTGLTRLK
ncbi:MAG: transposase [Nitrososphaerota archaeon]|nr:transposase [Nitrososphaerota archaeon]